jgi:transcriptional regulator of acetoin/glycerol metabolism
LVDHLLTTRQIGKTRFQVETDAMQALHDYRWPGNIRELANVLERAQILAEEHLITVDDLPEAIFLTPPPVSDPDTLNLAEVERRTVQAALAKTKGNKVHAANILGITRRTLYRLVQKYGLDLVKSEGVGEC